MSGYFFSPEDHLQLEEAKRSRTYSLGHSDDYKAADDSAANKKQRRLYEGEPDTSKWTVQPAPDIFSAEQQQQQQQQQQQHQQQHQQNADMAPFSDCTSIGVDAKAAASIAGAHLLPADTEYAEEEQAPGIEPSEDAIRQIIMLRDAQNDFERRLAEHRKRIVHEQEKVLRQIEAREIVCPMPRKEQDEILRQHRLELERTDKRTIEKLDELRYQQQISLQSLGVDGFYPSSSVAVMERQRSILKHLLSKHSS